MGKKIRFFLLSITIATIGYAAVPQPGTDAPPPDYNTYFTGENDISITNDVLNKTEVTPSGDVNYTVPAASVENKIQRNDLVGDDSLPKSSITGAFSYTKETGDKKLDRDVDTKGTTILKDPVTGDETGYLDELPKSDEYKDTRTEYFNSYSDGSTVEERRDKLQAAKEAAKKESFDHGFNLKTWNETLMKDLKPSGTGRSIVNKMYLQPRENATEEEINASNFYRQNYGISPDLAKSTQMKYTNVEKLKRAYDFVKDYEQLAKSKLNNGVISCYISRALVPAFYCPYPDMNDVTYPDYTNPNGDPLKVSSQEAEKTCNDVCWKERSCVSYNVLNDTRYDPGISEMTIFPYDVNNNKVTIPVSKDMQIATIEFDIHVEKSPSFNGTDDEFRAWLESKSPSLRFRTTVSKKANYDTTSSEFILFDRAQIDLKSDVVHQIFRIKDTSDEYYLKFYEPFFIDGISAINRHYNDIEMQAIGKVTISNIVVNYTNTDVYFCPFRQIVNTQAECPNGRIIDLPTASGVYHICVNAEHKIGPDPINGGFYDEESCAASCHEYRKCLPTYRHYASMSLDDLYKADVDCVDNDENSGCSKQLCEAYFADYEKRPINEIVIQNDNTRVYTVKDSVLTGEMRPKIDYDAELGTVAPDFNSTFQAEMKDAAFKSMVENQTYDRVKYTIGTPSPLKQAYQESTIGGTKKLEVIMKPNSYDFDNGRAYNIYSIMKFEQVYRPAYGVFIIDGNQVDAKNQDIEFKDDVYMIRLSTGEWKVFKQVNFSKVKSKKQVITCEAADGTKTTTDYNDGDPIPENCFVQTQVYWSEVPAYRQERNVFYDVNTDTFKNYSMGDIAPKYRTQEFSSNEIRMRFRLTEDLFGDLDNTPGGMIHSQQEKNNGASFARVYTGDYILAERGYPANVFVYSFYSDHDLTWQEMEDDYLNDRYVVWELANPHKYNTEIIEDGEIYNNIKPFIVGTPSDTTIEMEVTPKFTEEGQRVFKFIFLYDPQKDPFQTTNP